MLLSANGGAAWTNEKYEDPELPRRNSGEALGALEVNEFGISNLDIMTTFVVDPSLPTVIRFRSSILDSINQPVPSTCTWSGLNNASTGGGTGPG